MREGANRRLATDALALIAGALLVLAHAPFEWFWLAPPLYALLVWSWQDAGPRRAAWRGYLFGLGLFGCGVSWVYISLHTYGGAPPVFAALTTALLIGYLALYPALAGYLLNRFWPRPGPVRWLLVLPALWLLLEALRAWLLSGFPWLAPGYSQTTGPLAGLAPLGGVPLVGWAVLASAGLLLLIGYPRWRPPWLRASWFALLVGLWVGAGYADRLSWTAPAGEPLRVALIQGNIEQKQKWQPDSLERTLTLYSRLSADAADDSDLIVWPETAIPLFIEDLDPVYREALETHARETDTDYLIGAPSGNWDTREYYNGVLAVGGQGGFYRKHHLLPFGEYLPLRTLFDLFHRFVDIPMADFSAGAADQPLLRAGGHAVGVSICFESAFGNEIARALPDAAFLVNVSNDGWFGDSLAPAQHLQIARMRSIETRRWMARATNTGITALIDARGRVVEQVPQFEIAVLRGELQPLSGATPYVRIGDWPLGLMLCGLLVIGWRFRRRV